MRNIPYIALSLVLASGIASAASYTVDFDSDPSYPNYGDLNLSFEGVEGWVQSHSNPPMDGQGRYYPYAFISQSFASGNAASFGGFFNDMPPEPFSISRTFSELTAGEKSLSFQGLITDAGSLPPDPGDPWFLGRDVFGFNISDSADNLLLTVELRPVNQIFNPTSPDTYAPGLWEIYYAFGTDALVTSENQIYATSLNYFNVNFGEEGLRFSYGQGEVSPIGHSGTAAGYDVNDPELKLTFTYRTGANGEPVGDEPNGNGDNYFTVDNINVIDGIPEPTTAALAALGSLALLRRRRTH